LAGQTCSNGTCCGTACCDSSQICCYQDGPQNGLYCFTPTGTQATCPPGCGNMCVSDRNVKRDIVAVDPEQVLETLAQVPVSTWSYKRDDPSVRHMGPMAQDLHAAFDLGDTDKAYNPVDAHGIEFAAIQGLYARMQEQQARIERLERDNAALREKLTSDARETTCTSRP
jgi:hypothetical protein